MSVRDEFGLWVFRANARGAAPRVLVPVGPRDAEIAGASRRELALSRLATTSPGGNTPLHDTIVAGVRELGSGKDDAVTGLVVLTDGRDTASAIDSAGVEERVRGRGVRVFVVAIGEATCAERTLRGVTEHTAGACLETRADGLDAVLVELFDLLWGGPADDA
jgi:Mg-chelatase subunit ChlD